MKVGSISVFWAAVMLVGVLILLPTNNAVAQGTLFNGSTVLAGVPQPVIPKAAKGKQCIAPTDFMRKNHMNLLTHDRDKTVHLGDREIKASLKECVACHVVNGVDNKPVPYEDPKNFCRACHDYVAVKIDCFECHASKPGITLKSGFNKKTEEAEALAAYVAEKGLELKSGKPGAPGVEQ